ncbi:MAG TPA: hypothetical protein VL863_06120 [bacterium]|nr:hypothetical protein [bacterium]
MKRTIFPIAQRLLLFTFALFMCRMGLAHDPYELTATASLWTNRVDLSVVMEFRTGLRLAGVASRPPAGVSATNWFAENQAALLVCGKSFCQIQAGENLLPVRRVNVALRAEDHIEFQVEYPPATERPLRFDAAGLKALAGQGQYGLALTVLDMVHGKVLGQPVLFADAPMVVAEIAPPAKVAMVSPATSTIPNTTSVAVSRTNSPESPVASGKSGGRLLVSALVSGIAALLLLGIVWQRSKRKS